MRIAMNAPSVLVKQFLSNFDGKAPGWAPLLAGIFLWLEWINFPETTHIGSRTIPVPTEIVASGLTFLLYQMGDAVDEIVYKQVDSKGKTSTRKLYKQAYQRESCKAQKKLGVSEHGLYALASSLVTAAEHEKGRTLVFLVNEGAKFLRSLFVVFLFFADYCFGYFLFSRDYGLLVLCIVLAGIALFGYPWLKVWHIRRLYTLAAQLTGNDNYSSEDTNRLRFILWDGKHIATTRLGAPDRKCDELLESND